jgi:signal transduction histidine kinase
LRLVASDAITQRLNRLRALTDPTLAHVEIEELLLALLVRTRDLLGADTCAVLLLDEQAEELVARAAVGLEEEVERGVRIPMGRGFAGRVAAERRPVILEDVDHADVLNPILREKGIKSLLGVPLLVRGEAIGVLHVGVLRHRAFTAGEVELLQLVADRVAVSVERTRLHDETIRLDQLKASFVAIASHELRTPATAVYGVLRTLVDRKELSAEVKEELLQVGVQQGERLRRLLEELLDLSRLDSRAISVEPKPLVVRTVLDEIARESLPEGTELTLDVPDDLAAIADRRVLDRIVSNLLINATRYGRPPYVVIAERRDRHLRIAVCDDGPGVPDALRFRLFERFTRGDETSGTGLGLAISRAYARAHGGDLVYDPPERGARFELILPQG